MGSKEVKQMQMESGNLTPLSPKITSSLIIWRRVKGWIPIHNIYSL